MHFMTVEKIKFSGLAIYSSFKDGSFIAVNFVEYRISIYWNKRTTSNKRPT